jgi:predicted transcriptional regulator
MPSEPEVHSHLPQDSSLDEYHRALIEEGIRQCDAGELIDHETVVKMMADRIRKHLKQR